MLVEALPVFITRKDAFHLLLVQASASIALATTAAALATTFTQHSRRQHMTQRKTPLPPPLFVRCQVETFKKPELLHRALTAAMLEFAGEEQKQLKNFAAPGRRNSVHHLAAISQRNLELGIGMYKSTRKLASGASIAASHHDRPEAQPPGGSGGSGGGGGGGGGGGSGWVGRWVGFFSSGASKKEMSSRPTDMGLVGATPHDRL